jgi:hypothetical protein
LTRVLFVSVNQSFNQAFTLPELEVWVERAWAISVEKARSCDRVIAIFEGAPVAAWRLRGAFVTDQTYLLATGDTRPRIGLGLGDPMPILSAYNDVPSLRHGVGVHEIDVEPLRPERTEPHKK